MLPNFSSSSTKEEPSWCHGLPTFSAYFCEYSVKEDETVYLLLPTSYPPQQEKWFLATPCPCCVTEVVLQAVLGLEIWTEVILCWLAPEQAGHRQNGQLVSRIVLCLSVADVAACFIFWLFGICTESGIRSCSSDWDGCIASASEERMKAYYSQ